MVSLFGSSPAQAAIVNGSFETGDFSQWNTIGNTSIQTSAYGTGPSKGTYDALLSTGETSPVTATSLEDFVGLLPGSLNSVGNGDTFQGSAIKQTFSANAGQVLTFDWDFLTNEATPSQFFNDFSFVNISSSAGKVSLSKLADTSSALSAFPTVTTQIPTKALPARLNFKLSRTQYRLPERILWVSGLQMLAIPMAFLEFWLTMSSYQALPFLNPVWSGVYLHLGL